MPTNEEMIYRLVMSEDAIDSIQQMDPITRKILDTRSDLWIFPAKHYVVSNERKSTAIAKIRHELAEQLKTFEENGQVLEAERLSRRTRYDIEMIEQIGYCNGIENYSRFFDGRNVGEPPYTLMDYFPEDFLVMIDESHVTIPQIGGMYAGDQARKNSLIDHGFRLPSARDNRPLQFDEFEKKIGQTIFVSATPGPYEKKNSEHVVEQIIRPTGLVDPVITVRPVTAHDPLMLPLVKGEITRSPLLYKEGQGEVAYPGQVEDLIKEIEQRVALHERTLVTTLTKKMAEDLSEFLKQKNIAVQYLHSGVDTLDRITILSDLRRGKYDVLVGVNLLREGLDLPEVTLVAILDADKEGFLRSDTSIIQTIGRAARHVKGEVLLYADHMTGSLKRAIEETERRRKIQIAYNTEHNITPESIVKEIHDIRAMFGESEERSIKDILKLELKADSHEIQEVIKEKEVEMREAARKLDFETAALLRDEVRILREEVEKLRSREEKKSTVPKKQKKNT
jgi:excinuclease ABC subunit B